MDGFLFRPYYGDGNVYPPGVTDDVLRTWKKYFPRAKKSLECNGKKMNLEAWMTFACLLHEADRSYHKVIILPPNDKNIFASGHPTTQVLDNRGEGESRYVFLGAYAVQDSIIGLPLDEKYVLIGPGSIRYTDSSKYYKEAGFLHLAGRNSFVLPRDESVQDFLAAFREPLFVKTPYKGLAKIFQPPDVPEFLWEPQRSSDLIFQDVFEPTYEYRIVIWDETLICGAGAIHHFSPAFSVGVKFDNRMVKDRNERGCQVEHRQDLVDQYVKLAEEWLVWVAWPNSAYVLDVAMNGDKPVVIECNPLLNAGMFAHDVSRIVQYPIGMDLD